MINTPYNSSMKKILFIIFTITSISAFSLSTNYFIEYGSVGIEYEAFNDFPQFILDTPNIAIHNSLGFSLSLEPIIVEYDFNTEDSNIKVFESSVFFSFIPVFDKEKYEFKFRESYTKCLGPFFNTGYDLNFESFYFDTGLSYIVYHSYETMMVKYMQIDLGYSIDKNIFYSAITFDFFGMSMHDMQLGGIAEVIVLSLM